MTIGIPKALLYYKYGTLWETFFRALGCDVAYSALTTRQTLEDGARFSIDEACIPSKLYMGHVYSLLGVCDRILVPRVESFGPREEVCVKFNALYDIVRNTFPAVPLLCYNLHAQKGAGERKGFVGMARNLGKSPIRALAAYNEGKEAQRQADAARTREQERLLEEPDTLKILLVTHPYNIHDPLLGGPIVRAVRASGGTPVFADALDKAACAEKAPGLSEHLYWTYSKELVGAVGLCAGQADGILLITAFPCGPDSLVNELLLRKLKGVPVAHILLDELSGEAGLVTRIESFLDIIKEKKRHTA